MMRTCNSSNGAPAAHKCTSASATLAPVPPPVMRKHLGMGWGRKVGWGLGRAALQPGAHRVEVPGEVKIPARPADAAVLPGYRTRSQSQEPANENKGEYERLGK